MEFPLQNLNEDLFAAWEKVASLKSADESFTRACATQKASRDVILGRIQTLFKKHQIGQEFSLHLSHRHNLHGKEMLQVITETDVKSSEGVVISKSQPRGRENLRNVVPITWVLRKLNDEIRFIPIEFSDAQKESKLASQYTTLGHLLSEKHDFAREFWTLQEKLDLCQNQPVFGITLVNPAI